MLFNELLVPDNSDIRPFRFSIWLLVDNSWLRIPSAIPTKSLDLTAIVPPFYVIDVPFS